MQSGTMKYPFEADYQEILADPDRFVTAVFSSLASDSGAAQR